MTTTTTGFDERALAAVPSSAPFLEAPPQAGVRGVRNPPDPLAGDRGVALHGPGGPRLRPPAVRRGRPRREPGPGARGDPRGRRPGRRARRAADPTELRGDGHPPRSGARGIKGVWFGDLDRAIAERPDLVEPYLHALVPTDRSKFTALHAAFRTAGTFLYVPPGVEIGLPLQDDDVDRRGGLGGLPEDAPGGRRERRGHPHRPLRLAAARPSPQRRDRRDPCRPGLARAVRRAPGVRRGRDPPRGPAGADRQGRRPEVARGGVRREPRARRRSRRSSPRTAAARRCSASTSATPISTSTTARSRITWARAPRATCSTRVRCATGRTRSTPAP